MKASRLFTVIGGLALGLCLSGSSATEAGYYAGWNYYSSAGYYYNTYYYQPTQYHYCVHYPSQPQYVYYYNPYRQVYWGRYDLKGKPGAEYSLLAEADRKKKLSDIPEEAFPKPGKLPTVEGTNETLEAPPAPPETAPATPPPSN